MPEPDPVPAARTGTGATPWWARPFAQDALLAGALVILCVLVNAPPGLVGRAVAGGGPPDRYEVSVVVWWVATAFITGAVVLRRRWPLPALAVATAAVAVHLGQQMTVTIIDLGVAVLLYTVALRYRRAVSLTVLGVLVSLTVAWNVVAAASGRPVPGLPSILPPAMTPGIQAPEAGDPPARVVSNTWTGSLVVGSILVAAWATGAGASSRRAYLDQMHARARDLERQRDQQAELAAAAERARISRELHDVVAHGLSVMVTQAQGAQAALDRRPADARTALEAIIRTGRDSLADMRRALARDDAVEDAWHPAPGLSRLPHLISQVTDAGTRVRLHIQGTPSPLPAAVDLSAYRIVQEALTNTMKHAGPGAEADVTLSYQDTALDIQIRDNGFGPASSDGHGTGLLGMRERVRLLGGRFTARPLPAGGFVVHAVIPLPGSEE